MWLFWLLVGALATVGARLWNRFFTRKGRKAAWLDWVIGSGLYAYWAFVLYFVLMSLGELQTKPALVGFIIFGGIGLILVIAYRLILARRFGKSHA